MDKIYNLFAYRADAWWQCAQESFNSEVYFFQALSREEVCNEIGALLTKEDRFDGDNRFTFYLQYVEGGEIKTIEFESNYRGDDKDVQTILLMATKKAETIRELQKEAEENEKKRVEEERRIIARAERFATWQKLNKEFSDLDCRLKFK